MTQQFDLQTVIDLFLKFYSENKHKNELSQITDFLLSQALSARGYNNFRDNIESGELFFIKEILAKSNPKLCIDVGANVGGYSKEILTLTDARVIAFEPLPIAFDQLAREMIPFSDRVVLENMGVGFVNENLIIHYNPNALEHASFSEAVKQVSYVSNDEKIVVPVVSLDSYCKEKDILEVDFIKIDTEGFESEVFMGAKRVFAELRPKYIQIEFNWHQLFRNTSLNYFAEILPEYDVFQLIPNGWVKRDPKDPYTNIFHFSNFVFVRRS
jgi:FkbM family methyltransferase